MHNNYNHPFVIIPPAPPGTRYDVVRAKQHFNNNNDISPSKKLEEIFNKLPCKF